VTHDGDQLVLTRGEAVTDAVDAVRALAAAAWAHPEWNSITAAGDAASAAVSELGLDRFAGWSVRAASAT